MNITKNFPMSQVTSFGVGGPADYFCKPTTVAEIQAALQYGKQHNLPITLIGYGSNILVTDKGIRGLVIQLAEAFAEATVSGTLITASAGCLYSSVSKLAAHHSLTGLEFAVGIPGSLGGAIFMNAGAYGGEIGPLIEEITWVSPEQISTWSKDEFTYSYRYSRAQAEQVIVAQAKLKLSYGNREDIFAKMKELQSQRQERQPLDQPSAGSTFKRPQGHYVGPMIEEAGLKGYQLGGAQVSPKHAGFIVNTGNATAQDILDLISYIQETIQAKYNIQLEPEVRIIGER